MPVEAKAKYYSTLRAERPDELVHLVALNNKIKILKICRNPETCLFTDISAIVDGNVN